MKKSKSSFRLISRIASVCLLTLLACCAGCQAPSTEPSESSVYLEPADANPAITPSVDKPIVDQSSEQSLQVSDIVQREETSVEIMNTASNTAASTLEQKYDIPKHLQTSFTAVDGWLKVIVDADIILPSTNQLPVAKTEPADFSQDIVNKLFGRLCGKLVMVDANGKASDGTLVNRQERFTDGGVQVNYSTTGVTLNTKDVKTVFNVINLPNPRSAIKVRMANISYWTAKGLHDFSAFPISRVGRETAVPKAASGKLSITPAKARGHVEALIKDTGMIIADSYLVDDAKRYTNTMNKPSRYAYKFLCTRSINGVPTSPISGESAEQIGVMQTKSWMYELMEVIVDDAGIISLYWYSPHNITKVTNADAKLLPFSTIQTKFKDAMDKEYSALKSKYSLKGMEIQVSQISLSLQRISNGSIDNGTYVPAWNFYGKETRVDNSGDQYHSPRYAGCSEICLSINAMDGSTINVRTGK